MAYLWHANSGSNSQTQDFTSRVSVEVGAKVMPTLRVGAICLVFVGRLVRTYALPVAGLALFTTAAATWHSWAGLIMAGISCFALEMGRGGKADGDKADKSR